MNKSRETKTNKVNMRENDDLEIDFSPVDIDDRLVVVSFKIKRGVLRKLDVYAARQWLSRSEVIRYAIEDFLKREGVLDENQ